MKPVLQWQWMFFKAFVRTFLLCLPWQVTRALYSKAASGDPATPSGDLVPQSVLMFHQWIAPVSSQTEEWPPPTKEPPLLQRTGPELDIQPEELLQKNVDNFSLPPVIKDKLFITFGLGDHLFGLFIVLWDVLNWHLPKPGERRERKGRWFVKIRSLFWRGWVTVRTAAQLKYLDFAFMCCSLTQRASLQLKSRRGCIQCLLFLKLGMNSSICRCGAALVQAEGCDGVGIGSPFIYSPSTVCRSLRWEPWATVI